jgi:hypothetical protein
VAKKDTAATVLGMLSTTGASTRPTSPPPTPEPTPPVGEPIVDIEQPVDAAAERPNAVPTVIPEQSSVAEEEPATTSAGLPDPPERASTRPAGRGAQRRRAPASNGTTEVVVPEVPRTLRLRASTAAAVRDAWLEAKRDDVLLSHQDFASDLLDAALARRRSPRR